MSKLEFLATKTEILSISKPKIIKLVSYLSASPELKLKAIQKPKMLEENVVIAEAVENFPIEEGDDMENKREKRKVKPSEALKSPLWLPRFSLHQVGNFEK